MNFEDCGNIPLEVLDAADTISEWAKRNNYRNWRVNAVASRDQLERAERERDEANRRRGETVLMCQQIRQEIDHYKRLATQRGARMQTLRKWLCLEVASGSTEVYDSLDEVWCDFTIMRPECADWFDGEGKAR